MKSMKEIGNEILDILKSPILEKRAYKDDNEGKNAIEIQHTSDWG